MREKNSRTTTTFGLSSRKDGAAGGVGEDGSMFRPQVGAGEGTPRAEAKGKRWSPGLGAGENGRAGCPKLSSRAILFTLLKL